MTLNCECLHTVRVCCECTCTSLAGLVQRDLDSISAKRKVHMLYCRVTYFCLQTTELVLYVCFVLFPQLLQFACDRDFIFTITYNLMV